jgi:predicted ArsR family transcriptional regulator
METTRDQVLRLVRQRREVTVARIAETLAMSQAAIRRHLDGLRADGLVDVRFERHSVGRPSLLFFATERGEEAVSHGYLQLVSRLFRHLNKMGPEEVGGRSGRDVMEWALAGVAEEVAADHRDDVRGVTLAERVDEASRALKREGIVDSWEQHGESFRMVNGDCPYLRLAEMSDAPCRSDRQSIELLVRAPVEQLQRIASGGAICEYIVRDPGPNNNRKT